MDIDPIEDLRYAIEWYRDVVPPADSFDGPSAPPAREIRATLEEYSSLLAPYALPVEIEWFWRTWSAQAVYGLFDLLAAPQLDTAESSLYTWTMHADIRSGGEIQLPSNMVSVLYSSHWFHLTDVTATGPDRPGVLWDWGYGSMNFELRHASLAALFRATTEMLELRGEPVPTVQPERMWSSPAENDPSFHTITERHLVAAGLGDAVRIVPSEDHLAWPVPWRNATGIGRDATATSQPTHTAASFIEAARHGPVTGRLHGTCRERMGGGFGPGGSFGAIMVFTDHTGTLPLALFEGVSVVGGRSGRFEVEVEATEPVGDLPSSDLSARIQAAALSGDPDAAEAVGTELIAAASEAIRHLPRITRMVALGS